MKIKQNSGLDLQPKESMICTQCQNKTLKPKETARMCLKDCGKRKQSINHRY